MNSPRGSIKMARTWAWRVKVTWSVFTHLPLKLFNCSALTTHVIIICPWHLMFVYNTEVCGFCRKPVALSEPAIEALNRTYHDGCFQCRSCHIPLAGKQYYNKAGIPLCEECYQVGPSLYSFHYRMLSKLQIHMQIFVKDHHLQRTFLCGCFTWMPTVFLRLARPPVLSLPFTSASKPICLDLCYVIFVWCSCSWRMNRDWWVKKSVRSL